MRYTPPLNVTPDNDHYIDANPMMGIEGSIISAAAIEPCMREIVNAISAAGLTPSGNDMTQLTQAIKRMSANSTGENSIPTYYAGEFKDFFEQTPPAGWAVRDGSVLSSADVNFPEIWAELQKAENAFKLKSLTDWNALSAAAGGIGGVPYFVVDTTAMTIKLPDTRTDFFRNGNSNTGTWQGDAIRNILGSVVADSVIVSASGAMALGTPATVAVPPDTGSGRYFGFSLDASRIVPTAPENRPRNIALLGCVCIEPAKAQRNEATTTAPGAVYLASGADDQRANAMPNVAMAAGLGMPSGRYINLTLSSSGSSYTALEPGYYVLVMTLNEIATTMRMSIESKEFHVEYNAVTANDVGRIYIPAMKGDTISVSYALASSIQLFRFIYAEGAY